ncbi:MAG: hypothetical protein ACF8CQ_12240, partial [Rhodopirellula sp. JB044]|uniref:hypothetical protein n=1 Tax=Rhodopirellula sp. JB044 TaxID=3342844 RepID=UPI00370B125F
IALRQIIAALSALNLLSCKRPLWQGRRLQISLCRRANTSSVVATAPDQSLQIVYSDVHLDPMRAFWADAFPRSENP